MGENVKEFPVTMEGLSEASAFLMEVLSGSDSCATKTKSELMIAMDEIGSNIVRYSGAKTFSVSVELAEDPPSVRMVFSDSGTPYNPLEKSDPDVSLSAEERSIGGLGIFMVKKMMDEIHYTYENGHNVLVIGKRRP